MDAHWRGGETVMDQDLSKGLVIATVVSLALWAGFFLLAAQAVATWW
jgi:hypothetical protein